MAADAPFGLALAAGVLAAVNPCGFALLPADVSLLVHDGEPDPPPARALGRAAGLTAAMTLGFVAVFGAFGLLAAPAASWLAERLPWLTIVIGVVLVAVGGWLASGRELPSPVPKLRQAPVLRRRVASMTLFGAAFAIASLGCTIGPFLGVVVAAFTMSPAQGVALFLAYSGGMAVVVGTVAGAVALAQQTVVTWLRRSAPIVARGAGVIMVLSGAYVAWYGWYEIRVLRNASTEDPIIDGAATVQRGLAAFVDAVGAAGFAAALAAAAVGCALWYAVRRRRSHR
ncbi:MAG: cytochrome c biogenesis protein CcdA [Hamadaea sp.]|nr:cytochrome c biogenesis protein CcdA [Hamadaea sp.]